MLDEIQTLKFAMDIPAIEQAQVNFTDLHYPSFKLYFSIKNITNLVFRTTTIYMYSSYLKYQTRGLAGSNPHIL